MAKYGVVIETPIDYQKYLCRATEIGFADVVDGLDNALKIVDEYKDKLCHAMILLLVDENGLLDTRNLHDFCEEIDYTHTLCNELEEIEEGEDECE